MGSQVNRRPTSEGERGEWRRGTAARSSVRVASVRPHLFEWGGITHAETAAAADRRHLLVLGDDGDIAHIKEKEERKRAM